MDYEVLEENQVIYTDPEGYRGQPDDVTHYSTREEALKYIAREITTDNLAPHPRGQATWSTASSTSANCRACDSSKMGVSFEKGEVAMAKVDDHHPNAFTIHSRRTGWDTLVPMTKAVRV